MSGTLPDDVEKMLGLVEIWDLCRKDVQRLREVDLVTFRRRWDVNAIIDHLGEAETNLSEAIRAYRKPR